jgi:hypothetical protein
VTACIGEPVSWPRLERFALGGADPSIAAHLAACPACRQCLDQIRDDVVALPPLDVTARPARPARRWHAPVFGAAAAAIIALVVCYRMGLTGSPEASRVQIAVKGVGEVTLELVRERAGAISYEARRYVPGDRWKVVVSCPPRAAAWIDVAVADGTSVDHPLAPSQLSCGNRVVVPGAFTITGSADNRVCATIAAAPGAAPGAASTACLTLRPE